MSPDKAPMRLSWIRKLNALNLKLAHPIPVAQECLESVDGNPRHASSEQEQLPQLVLIECVQDFPEPLYDFVLGCEVPSVESVRFPVREIDLLGALKQEVKLVHIKDAHCTAWDHREEATQELFRFFLDLSDKMVFCYSQTVLVDIISLNLNVSTILD